MLVCGGRDYDDLIGVSIVLDAMHVQTPFSMLIEGGAKGADACASAWAWLVGVPIVQFPADWGNLSHPDAVIKTRRDGTKYDALAGLRRNQRMLDDGKPDLVVAFPGGNGTADMVRRARRAGVEVREIA